MNSIDGRWYTMDDTKVSAIKKPFEIVGKQAYVLFYKQRVAKK